MLPLCAALLAAALSCAPATAQVRVIVNGEVQTIPDGMVRTISYRPDGRPTIRDEAYGGSVSPGAVTVTTTETIDEDEAGHMISRTAVTRIEPVAAVAYAAPPLPPPLPPPPRSAPHLAIDPVTFEAPARDPAAARTLRIRRDPQTGHFIAAVRLNGVEIRAIVDTGAQSTILSPRDASASGVSDAIVDTRPMIGIGGYTMLNIARVRSLEVGGQQLGGFSAAIGQEGLSYSLLGQTEIARLGRIVIEDGIMTITPRADRLASR